jgi:hypothetical protein
MSAHQPELLVYAAKFVCGVFDPEHISDREPGIEGPVRPGSYATAINVHNPNPRRKIAIRKKALLLHEGSDPRKPIFPRRPEEVAEPRPPHELGLPPDGGFEIDCPDIREVLLTTPDRPGPKAPEFVKGMVVIETRPTDPVDVVAVYTVDSVDQKTGEHSVSIAVERVTPTPIAL